ncbi:hypothetical protein NIES21_15370 [Anabaenopsis circularis NIES-21]|uniref:Uncharacterized protein n=1 Tax=Anabaenopsis circularis NIES-21 TaxID=1085406 RepID=A0A1Z4GEG5_9CYAN|nr:hypothetical protein NIES21_15370 [Anabaenopsis circularis NIES-21]
MKPLSQLITETSQLLTEICDHPDYQALLNEGHSPDLTMGDACTALVYLSWEVDPLATVAGDIPSGEVSDHG